MGKRKFNYIHLYNGKEVDRGSFVRKLGLHCVEVIGNDPNPLLNIEVVDEVKLRKLYARIKRGTTQIFWGDDYSECFSIKRVSI